MTFVNVCVCGWYLSSMCMAAIIRTYIMFFNQCHLANEFFFFPEIVHKPVKGGGVRALSAFSYFH